MIVVIVVVVIDVLVLVESVVRLRGREVDAHPWLHELGMPAVAAILVDGFE